MKAACEVEEYVESASLFGELAANLWAISAALRGLTLGEVADESDSQGWAFKQETVVRLGWVQYHQALLMNKRSVGFPFHGRVGPRVTRARQRDREFHTLLLLSRWIRHLDGRQLLLNEVSDSPSPDFICDIAGSRIGVEVTEATDEIRSKQEAFGDRLSDRLWSLAAELGLVMGFESTAGLHEFVPEGEVIEAKIRAEASSGVDAVVVHHVGHHRCEITIERGSAPSVWYSDPRGYDADDLAQAESDGVRAICESVERKVAGPKPTTRPCILVIYLNLLEEVEVLSALERSRREMSINCSSHFDEVWAVHEEACERLV